MTTILVVEDHLEMQSLIQRELKNAGYQVITASDGLECLSVFERAKPDLLILDWMLPQLDGLEVIRRIRQTSALPILMLTARGDESDRVIGLEVGADDYLSKPFGMRELLARVHALLRRLERIQEDQSSKQELIQWQGVVLDTGAYTAMLDGQLMDLTHTEFELLHLLIRNPGRVFTRRYLQESIWDQRYLEGDRSVDNAILRLRRKLGPYGDAVETVRSVGYRLRSN
jgi:DNA-binding response OmpR family regulator